MNKFKEGDLVEILPLTEIEKKRYPPTWMPEMSRYIGLMTTVETDYRVVDTNFTIQTTGRGTM